MPDQLTDDEHAIFQRLTAQIGHQRKRNELRSRYRDGEHILDRMPVSVPVSMQSLAVPIGWPAKAISKFCVRLTPRGYSSETGSSLVADIEDVFADNQMEFLEAQAIAAAAEHGCSFVFTTKGVDPLDPDVLITLRDAHSASALLDPRTRRVTAALEVPDRSTAVLYLPHRIATLNRTNGGPWSVAGDVPNPSGRVLCAVYTHGATIDRPFGTSRITRPLMGLTDMGVRTFLRSEVSADAYAAPRGFLIDVLEEQFEQDHNGRTTGWENIIGAFSAIASQMDEETGEVLKPDVKMLPQLTMQPFGDQFRLIAAQVSGETSIPLQYLGVVSDSNPTSAAAVEANEVDLVREVRGQFPSYNLGRKALAVNVLTALDPQTIRDPAALADIRKISPLWDDPRTRSVSEQSQFVALQVQAGNFQAGTESTLRQLPIDPVEARRIAIENRASFGLSTLNQLLGQTASPEATDLAATETTTPAAAEVAAV